MRVLFQRAEPDARVSERQHEEAARARVLCEDLVEEEEDERVQFSVGRIDDDVLAAEGYRLQPRVVRCREEQERGRVAPDGVAADVDEGTPACSERGLVQDLALRHVIVFVRTTQRMRSQDDGHLLLRHALGNVRLPGILVGEGDPLGLRFLRVPVVFEAVLFLDELPPLVVVSLQRWPDAFLERLVLEELASIQILLCAIQHVSKRGVEEAQLDPGD